MKIQSIVRDAIIMTLSSLEKDFQNKSCFDFLPEIPARSVNLVLIDPPYEISRDTNF